MRLELFLTQSRRPIKRSNVIKAHLFTCLPLSLDDGKHCHLPVHFLTKAPWTIFVEQRFEFLIQNLACGIKMNIPNIVDCRVEQSIEVPFKLLIKGLHKWVNFNPE